jgi:hypothetical protein
MAQETQTEAPAPKKGSGSKILWIILIILIVLIALGVGGCYLAKNWIQDKAGNIEEQVGTMPETTSESEEGNPYDEATTISPTSEIAIALNDDLSTIFETVFEGSKLTTNTSNEGYEILDYVVARVITAEDAEQIKSLLREKGYKATYSDASSEVYNYRFTATILGKEYDNITATIYLAEEDSYNSQKITVMLYG